MFFDSNLANFRPSPFDSTVEIQSVNNLNSSPFVREVFVSITLHGLTLDPKLLLAASDSLSISIRKAR